MPKDCSLSADASSSYTKGKSSDGDPDIAVDKGRRSAEEESTLAGQARRGHWRNLEKRTVKLAIRMPLTEGAAHYDVQVQTQPGDDFVDASKLTDFPSL
ncbi:hypothetical protein A0H81_11145 [Grifola frondosa]|uniref:Uncharacterized protein n=1 Tax=Grifola frondosa TaxID=5627 RepID=A0A1C7LW77_GRIFR|nr:hypothetical protein A0H81_11145 [Grifola frondosa]